MQETHFLTQTARVEQRILVLRRQRVILDSDLAALYGVATMRLNEQVKRNLGRFPPDFMFRLTPRENARLISQIAISKNGRGGRRKLPLAFTEHGALMAANVLHTPRAVAASLLVVRAFVRLRQMTETHVRLAAKLVELEKRIGGHDHAIQKIVAAIRGLMEPLRERRGRRIGYHVRS